MAEVSKIEWTDSTFNPVIGCQHVSAGCDHCYAETLSTFRGWAKWGPHAERKRTSKDNWRQPYRWQTHARVFRFEHKRRQRVFCASLSDWLDNEWEREWRAELCKMIEDTPDLNWLLLTKRPGNFRKLAPRSWQDRCPKNVWFGTTTEDARTYQMRWPIVAAIPATVRFISYEPAVGPLGPLDIGTGVVPHWVIAGGESGNGARTMQPAWARQARDECRKHKVEFFLKQFGTYASNPAVIEKGHSEARAAELDPPTNGKGGGLLDGRLHRAFPKEAS